MHQGDLDTYPVNREARMQREWSTLHPRTLTYDFLPESFLTSRS
ncbi:MAG: hypothetical protein ACYCT2_00920 [Thermoplasmataceae archaeon]